MFPLLNRRYLRLLAELICRRPWVFLVAGVLAAAGGGIYAAMSLEFSTSRNDLIGRDSEYWRLYSEYAREFRAEEDYVVVFESDKPPRNQAAVDAFVASALARENNPHASDPPKAQKFIPDDLFARVNFEPLQKRFLYFLSVEELTELRDSLPDFKRLLGYLQSRPKLDRFFWLMNHVLRRMGTAPDAERHKMEEFLPVITAVVKQMGEPSAAEGGLMASPWAGAFLSDEMVKESERELKWNGYHAFHDGHMFLVLVHPRAQKEEMDIVPRHAATIEKLRRIRGELQQQFPDVRTSLTGEPVLDYDEMISSQRDTERATLLSLALICGLFALSFREILRPLLAAGCIALVLAMSVGYATLAVGNLNIITITCAVMLLGLGIDLGIQFIARYEEELARGEPRARAIQATLEHTGPSIFTAGVTNAAAFFAMGLSGFRGVIELGIIAGGGMVIATVATLTVLPALLLVAHRKREKTSIPAQGKASRVERLLLRRPMVTLIVCGAVTAAALVVGCRVRFDYNVLKLQSRGLESVETEFRLLEADAQSTIFAAVVAGSLDETRTLHARMEKLPTVHSVVSVAPMIPEQQEAKAPLIRQIRQQLDEMKFAEAAWVAGDSKRLLKLIRAVKKRATRLALKASERGDGDAEKRLRELEQAIKQTRERLERMDESERDRWLGNYQRRLYRGLDEQLKLIATQETGSPMTVADLPRELQRMFVGQTGKLLLRVFPRENIWEREPLVRFVRDVRSVAPNVTGTPLGLYEFVDALLRGYRNAALWALLVISIMIFIDFRSVCATILTVLPLLVGMVWMVGVMGLAGIPFNSANVMVLPLLVGIGVAYGIYIVKRCREDREPTFYGKSTGRAVVLTALAAMAAFGSLLIGSHQGIRSLGLVTVIGISGCLTAAMVLLPALVQAVQRKGWKL